jgi:hypothetical protein
VKRTVAFVSTMPMCLNKLHDVPSTQAFARLGRRLSSSTFVTSTLGQPKRKLQYAWPRTRPAPLFLAPTAFVSRLGPFSGQQWRSYANKPPGGGGGSGFPSFSLGPQHQKGEALKEYVCSVPLIQVSVNFCFSEYRSDRACSTRKDGSYDW